MYQCSAIYDCDIYHLGNNLPRHLYSITCIPMVCNSTSMPTACQRFVNQVCSYSVCGCLLPVLDLIKSNKH